MTPMDQDARVHQFAAGMWEWFSRRKRTLPWRDLDIADDTQRAYRILVSEVMLQQTQVSRVQVIFKQFLEKFPTLQALAAASNKDVILAWKGMGYNSRALRLRDAAKAVMDQHGGVFPRELDQLLAIKGIGAYTAGAIRNFAFGIPTPCVDTNIHRILHRVFDGPEPEKNDVKTQRKVLEFAGASLRIALDIASEKILNGQWTVDNDDKKNRAQLPTVHCQLNTADWHAALMDFGSLTCKKSNPLCEECPMSQDICKSAFRVKRIVKEKAKEPGRTVGAKFVPNRIFRGRAVDLLREAPGGLTLREIGEGIAADWSRDLEPWLAELLQKLIKDHMLMESNGTYRLKE
jgi:A/G-specific adenine glycosylase